MTTIAVHPSADMYGSDRMFLETVSALPGPVLAVVPGEGPLTEALASRGVAYEVRRFPVLRRVHLRTIIGSCRFLRDLVIGFPGLVRFLRRHGTGCLYVSTVVTPVWIYAGRLAGRRIVCHVHESEPDMSRLTSRMLLWPLRSAHRVIANSEDTKRWIAGSTNARVAALARVVHNGVAEPPAQSAEIRSSSAERQLVVVGRLSPRKGQDVALRALALLRGRGFSVSLTLVGDCFPGYEAVVQNLERLAEELGIAQHVRFEGFQPDPIPYVLGADVVLVPSRVEPFGLVAAEALMLGRPTVVSRVGGLPEVVTDGLTGRLVPPGQPEALAEVVAELLERPEAAAELAMRAQEDARRRFSLRTYPDRLLAALSEDCAS